MYNYGYDYTATADSLSNTGMMAAFMGFFTTYFIFILIICVISVIATWKIFVKAGKPGWAAIIPFYNNTSPALFFFIHNYKSATDLYKSAYIYFTSRLFICRRIMLLLT